MPCRGTRQRWADPRHELTTAIDVPLPCQNQPTQTGNREYSGDVFTTSKLPMCSSRARERQPDKDEVGGSSPPRPTTQTLRPAARSADPANAINRHACSFVLRPIASAPLPRGTRRVTGPATPSPTPRSCASGSRGGTPWYRSPLQENPLVAGIRHHRMAGLFRNWPCGPMRPNSLPQPRSFSTQSPQVLHLVDIWLASACVLTDHPVLIGIKTTR